MRFSKQIQIFILMTCVLCCACTGQNNGNTGDSDSTEVSVKDTLPAVKFDLQTECEYGCMDGDSWSYRATIKDGKVELSFNIPEAIRFLGIDEDQWHVGTEPRMVETKGDTVVSVFMKDIGQDYHPVLCMLMDDGTVEILDVFLAVENGDFETSGALHGFRDIKGFDVLKESDFDDLDDNFMDHQGIVAVNGKGEREEISLFYGPKMIMKEYEEDGKPYSKLFTFTSDWKITYEVGIAGEILEYRYTGKFWYSEYDGLNDESEYGYHFDLTDVLGDEPYTVDESRVNIKGSFKMATKDDKGKNLYEITPLKGYDFGGKSGKKEFYEIVDLYS